MLARAEVRRYILTLVQYYANTTDSYIHSVKTEPYVKEILNNLQYYPPETHPLSPAKHKHIGMTSNRHFFMYKKNYEKISKIRT